MEIGYKAGLVEKELYPVGHMSLCKEQELVYKNLVKNTSIVLERLYPIDQKLNNKVVESSSVPEGQYKELISNLQYRLTKLEHKINKNTLPNECKCDFCSN